MTLLEIILAIAVAGFVLASAATFVVSVSTIWMNRQDRNFFEDHTEGVAEFINASFAGAGVEVALDGGNDPSETGDEDDSPQDNREPDPDRQAEVEVGIETPGETDNGNVETPEEGGLLRVAEEPVGWARPPGFAQYRDPLLNFTLTGTTPLLIAEDEALTLGGVEVFLYFEPEEGLSLLWYPLLQEETEDEDDLRRTRLSSLVADLKYIYWDERFERWEEEEEPKEGDGEDQFLLPRFLKLTFSYGDEIREHTIPIPVPSTKALLF